VADEKNKESFADAVKRRKAGVQPSISAPDIKANVPKLKVGSFANAVNQRKAGIAPTPATIPTPTPPVTQRAPSPGGQVVQDTITGAAEGIGNTIADIAKTDVGKVVKAAAESPVGDLAGTIAKATLAPIISIGSAVLNALSWDNARAAGYSYAQAMDNKNGIITTDDLRVLSMSEGKIDGKQVKAIGWDREAGQPIYNIKATLTDKAAIEENEKNRRDFMWKNANAWVTNKKTVYGADVIAVRDPSIAPVDAAIEGLRYDLTNDAFVFLPFGSIARTIKSVSSGIKTGVKEVNAARKGAPSIKSEEAKKGMATLNEPSRPPVIRENLKGLGGKATERELAAAEKIAKDYTYRRGTLDPSEVSFFRDAVPSGLEAGYKQLRATLLSENTAAFLRNYAKRDISSLTIGERISRISRGEYKNAFGQKQLAVNVAIDFKNGGYNVLSGNYEVLASAPTRKEATEIAKKLRSPQNPDGIVVGSAKLPGDIDARDAAVDNADLETANKISEGGVKTAFETIDDAPIVMEPGVPHVASDGFTYLSDGENIRMFDSLEDAQTYVKNAGMTKAPAIKAQVVKQKGKFFVRVNDQLIERSSEAAAKAYAKGINKQEIGVPTPTRGGVPIVDSAVRPDASVSDLPNLKVSSGEAREAKSILRDVITQVKKTSGTRVASTVASRNELIAIVRSPGKQQIAKILASPTAKRLSDEIDKAGNLNGSNPFSLINIILNVTDNSPIELRNFATLFRNIGVRTERGELKKLWEIAAGKVWSADYPSPAVKKRLVEVIRRYSDDIKLYIRNPQAVDAIDDVKAKYDLISDRFGKTIADEILATGVLARDANGKIPEAAQKAYMAAESQILGRTQEVFYQSVEDLAEGLRRGDMVSPDSLLSVINAMDPSGKLVSKVRTKADKKNAEFLTEIFVGEGMQTMNGIQEKLRFSSDFDNLLETSGIAYNDILSSLMSDKAKAPIATPNMSLSINPEIIARAEVEETPENFARIVATRIGEADTGNVAAEALNTAFKERFDVVQEVRSSENSIEGISSLGDVFEASSKTPYLGKAFLAEEINEVFDQAVFSSIAGIRRDRFAKKKGPKDVKFGDYMVEQTIADFEEADALLGLAGLRIIRKKQVKDPAFDAAYKAEQAAAKAEGRPMAFDRKQENHFAYLHTGDIFKAISNNGDRNSLIKAFFPVESRETYKKNSLSIQNFGDAARYVLEMDAKGKPIEMKVVVDRILKGNAKMSLAPTDAFKKAMPGIATELATQLMNPTVINAMKETHLVKSIGLANRVIKTAKNVAGDIHRILLDAMQVNYMSGNLSKSDMVRALRGHLRKIAYTADFFRMSSGPLAEAAFRSWALVLSQRGRVVSESNEFLKLVDDNEFREFRTMLNQLYLYENPAAAARPGREGGKFYTDAEREAASLKFEEAKGLYQNVMDRRAEVLEGSAEVAKQWKKDLASAQGRLDRARDDAWKKGADTEHFFDGKWVASEKYNHAEAIKIAERQNAMYLEGKAGREMRVALVDTVPVIPKGKKLTQKQKAALLKQENLAMNDVQREIIKGQETDVAEQLLREIDENVLERTGLSTEEAVSVYAQQLEARQIYAATKMSDIEIINPNFIDYVKNYEIDLRYRDFQGGVGAFVKSIPERWHGSYGRQDMKGAMIGLETKASRIVSDFSSYTDYVFRKVYYGDRVLPGMRQAMSKQAPAQLRERVTQVDEAFGHMKNNTKPAEDASEVTKEAYALVKPIWDVLFDEKSSDFILKGIDPDFFMKELDNLIDAQGLGIAIPKSVRATGISDWAKGLPFGGKPDTMNAKTDEFISDFDTRRMKFESSASNPFLIMNRIAQAAANARFKIGIVRNFDAKFSYRSHNITSVDRAIAEGYVRPVTVFGDSKYLNYLPEIEKGGLYPPAALDQFASVVREMDYTANKPAGEILTSMSQVVQFLKATQTILMPRHLLGNFQGDTMMAFMRNVFSPGDWGSAARMAYKDAEEIVGAEYFKRFQSRLGGDVDGRKLELALRSVGFEDRKLLAPLKPGDDMLMADGTITKATKLEPYRQITIGAGDSKKTIKISEDQLRVLYKDNGIIEESYFQEDLGTLKDDIYLASDNVATNGVFKKLSARLRQTQRAVTKAPGDINASVSNVARVAHANKILNSRSWKSVDDAMEKIALELAVYHPTPKGLASTERKWGRVAFLTYYTWMRQAHIAVTRQLLENHRNISAVNSLLYTWNTAQGYQPQNRGVSYSDTSAVPSYLSSRVGGAVITDTSPLVGGLVSTTGGLGQTGVSAFLGGAIPTGQVGVSQLMIPFYDVINFHNLRVDPSRPLDENILNSGGRDFTQMPGLIGQVTENIGKNISLFGEPIYVALTGRDPSTGKPLNTEGAAGFLDYMLSFFGQTQLAKGLGLYTPFLQREENNESNPLTEDDRLIQLRNGLLNSKLTLPNDPQNIKNAQRERNARLREFEKEIQKMIDEERQN
jgi:hypothetical protein